MRPQGAAEIRRGAPVRVSRLGVGVVGLGFGQTWARAAASHESTRLVAICDSDPLPVDRLAAELRAHEPSVEPASYDAFDALLADPAVEAVFIFTPPARHASQAIAALRAGKHVLSAVPAATTVEDCRRLVEVTAEAALAAGTRYMLAENWPYVPTIRRARELYDTRALGRLYYAEAEYSHDLRALWHDRSGRPTWRLPLAPLLYPTHGTAPYLLMTGDRFVEAVAQSASGDAVEDAHQPAPAGGARGPEGTSAPWVETALFRAASGALFRLTNSFRNAHGGPGHFYSFHGSRGAFETGRHRETRRVAYWHSEARAAGGPGEWMREECTHRTPLAGGRYRAAVTGAHAVEAQLIVDDFVRAIQAGQPPPIGVLTAVNLTLPGICGHQSATEHRPVPIPDPQDWIE